MTSSRVVDVHLLPAFNFDQRPWRSSVVAVCWGSYAKINLLITLTYHFISGNMLGVDDVIMLLQSLAACPRLVATRSLELAQRPFGQDGNVKWHQCCIHCAWPICSEGQSKALHNTVCGSGCAAKFSCCRWVMTGLIRVVLGQCTGDTYRCSPTSNELHDSSTYQSSYYFGLLNDAAE